MSPGGHDLARAGKEHQVFALLVAEDQLTKPQRGRVRRRTVFQGSDHPVANPANLNMLLVEWREQPHTKRLDDIMERALLQRDMGIQFAGKDFPRRAQRLDQRLVVARLGRDLDALQMRAKRFMLNT